MFLLFSSFLFSCSKYSWELAWLITAGDLLILTFSFLTNRTSMCSMIFSIYLCLFSIFWWWLFAWLVLRLPINLARLEKTVFFFLRRLLLNDSTFYCRYLAYLIFYSGVHRFLILWRKLSSLRGVSSQFIDSMYYCSSKLDYDFVFLPFIV